MGHLVGKDLYRALGRKLDGLSLRAPYSDALHEIMRALYTDEEATLLVKMPWGLSSASRVARVTGLEPARVTRLLDEMSGKGLVIDIRTRGKQRYMPAPFAIGVFEFTMMRPGEGLPLEDWSRLFSAYLRDTDLLWAANAGQAETAALLRTIPHDGTVAEEARAEILDYESAQAIVASQDRFGIGICSCRHEKHHLGEKRCDAPLESCLSMGMSAEYMISHGFARAADRGEVRELMAASRERGLVFNADNVQRNVTYLCQCCGCCCNLFVGMRDHGYAGVVATSSYIARVDQLVCTGCGKCKQACPVDAISLRRLSRPEGKKRFTPEIDEGRCLGCGVCALRCETQSLKLEPRARRLIPPESTFEKVILQCLERGTLQNQMFDDPGRVSHKFLRAFVGGFLRLPPVKRALVSESLRSTFLDALRAVAGVKGHGDVTEL